MLEALLTSKSETLQLEDPLKLKGGDVLQQPKVHFTTYGKLNADKSNVVWIFHALTANSDPVEWWPGLVGEGCLFNPEDHFIVCANMLGSCYGSTEPTDFDFPLITISDIVDLNKRVFEHLGLHRIHVGIGGSMGGQQLLEWAAREPDLFDHIIPIATNVQHSPWGIAFNEAQRMALRQKDLAKGIEAARAIAMLSYRHYGTYQKSQLDSDGRINAFSASSYQNYQGEKLRKRFSPYSYWYLSKAMDSHSLAAKEISIEEALTDIKSKATVIGLETDMLFPPAEQERVAKHVPNSSLHIISSEYGHDGFLIEVEAITKIIKNTLK